MRKVTGTADTGAGVDDFEIRSCQNTSFSSPFLSP